MTVGRVPTEVYRQSVEKLPRAVGRARRNAILEVVVAAAALVALTTALPAADEAVDLSFVVGAFALFVSPYAAWRAGRRVRRYWNAFEMSIGADSVRVSAKGAGRATIRRDEIADIVERPRGLDVRAAGGAAVVHVPTTVEGYADARTRLEAWHPIVRRAGDLGASAALVALAGLAGALVYLGRGAPTLATGLVAVQLAAGVYVVDENRADPHLPAARKALAAGVALAATAALLVVALFVA